MSNKCWQGCAVTGTLTLCWRYCKLVQTLENNSAKASKGKCVLKDLVCPLLGTYSKEASSHIKQKMATRTSVKANFLIRQKNNNLNLLDSG